MCIVTLHLAQSGYNLVECICDSHNKQDRLCNTMKLASINIQVTKINKEYLYNTVIIYASFVCMIC